MNLVKQIDAFLQYLATEKGYSAHTHRAYARDLREFFDYIKAQYFGETTQTERGIKPRYPFAVGDVDGLMIRGYLAFLH